MNIDEYVSSLIELTKDHTIIISEKEIQSNTFDMCGQLQRREFFYLSPPCYRDGKRVIAILLLETGNIFPLFQGDEENLRQTIYNSLLGYTIIKSFTIYQLSIDKFTSDDEFNYILTTDNNIDIAAQLYAKLGGRLDVTMFMLYSTPLVVIKLPYINALPGYSVLYVDGNEVNIEAIDGDIFRQILYSNYENAKNSLQRILDYNPQLAQLVEQLEI